MIRDKQQQKQIQNKQYNVPYSFSGSMVEFIVNYAAVACQYVPS